MKKFVLTFLIFLVLVFNVATVFANEEVSTITEESIITELYQFNVANVLAAIYQVDANEVEESYSQGISYFDYILSIIPVSKEEFLNKVTDYQVNKVREAQQASLITEEYANILIGKLPHQIDFILFGKEETEIELIHSEVQAFFEQLNDNIINSMAKSLAVDIGYIKEEQLLGKSLSEIMYQVTNLSEKEMIDRVYSIELPTLNKIIDDNTISPELADGYRASLIDTITSLMTYRLTTVEDTSIEQLAYSNHVDWVKRTIAMDDTDFEESTSINTDTQEVEVDENTKNDDLSHESAELSVEEPVLMAKSSTVVQDSVRSENEKPNTLFVLLVSFSSLISLIVIIFILRKYFFVTSKIKS